MASESVRLWVAGVCAVAAGGLGKFSGCCSNCGVDVFDSSVSSSSPSPASDSSSQATSSSSVAVDAVY